MSGPDRDDLWLKVQERIAIAADDHYSPVGNLGYIYLD